MAKESTNKVMLAGPIVEITHKRGEYSGKAFLAGTVSIETGEDNIIPVDFFQYATTKEGKANGVYASLETVIKEYKTISEHSREEADHVEVSTGNLTENAFYGRDGKLVRQFKIGSPFFNRKSSVEPKNEFIVSGEVVRIQEELKDDVPTGALILTLLVVGYGDKANLIDFRVEGEQKADYVKTNYSPGQEVKIEGEIIVREVEKRLEEEVAFGDPIVQVKTWTEKALLVKGGTPPVETSYTTEQKQAMLSERTAKLEKDKKKAEKKESKPQKASQGFDLL
jgi:hypothetical protein